MPPEPKNHLATRIDWLVRRRAAKIAGDVEVAEVIETIWQFIESGSLRLVECNGSVRIEPGGITSADRRSARAANMRLMKCQGR